MQITLLKELISAVLSFSSSEVATTLQDHILDVIEDSVAKSKNKVDDAVILPLINRYREMANIPDND